MNIYQRELRLVKIIKFLYYETNRLQQTEPCSATNPTLSSETETSLLIDVSIRTDKDVENKEADKDLLAELERKSNAKAKVIPVIISANGSLSRSFQRRLGKAW
jgi:hypothetical protein